MALVKLQAGVEFDLPTAKEYKQAVTDAMVELHRGVRFVTRPFIGTADAATGALSITPRDFGPEGGFTWGVTMISIAGLTVGQTVNVHVNEVSSTKFVTSLITAAPVITFPKPGLVLNPEELIIVSGTVTASQVVTAVIRAVELPEPMRWQLV